MRASRMHRHISILALLLLASACAKEGAEPAKPPVLEADLPVSPPTSTRAPPAASVSAPTDADDRDVGVGIIGLGVVGSAIIGEVSCADPDPGGLEFPLYAAPSGARVATVRMEKDEYAGCYPVLVSEGRPQSIGVGSDPDFREISYEAKALVFFETRGGYARILEHRLSPGVWVKIDEVPGEKIRFWTDLLTEAPRHYYRHEGQILRSEPSEDSSAIVTIRYEAGGKTPVHEVLPTGQVLGRWGQFEVVEWDGDFRLMSRGREPSRTGNSWKGWLRLVDDSGQPLFWFYTRD